MNPSTRCSLQLALGEVKRGRQGAVGSTHADAYDDSVGGISPGETASMYERFTDRARKVMQLANQEAQRFNHEYIGTEHVLLGLVKEGSGVAANVLKNLDIDLR